MQPPNITLVTDKLSAYICPCDCALVLTLTAPPQPTITAVVRSSQSTISVSWSLPNFQTGVLTNFQVWYAPTSSVLPERYQNMSALVPADSYSVNINRTDPTLAYTIQVRAKSGAGYGPFSQMLTARGTCTLTRRNKSTWKIVNYKIKTGPSICSHGVIQLCFLLFMLLKIPSMEDNRFYNHNISAFFRHDARITLEKRPR